MYYWWKKWECTSLVNHLVCATKRNTLSSILVAQNKLEVTRLELVVYWKVTTKSTDNIVIMSSTWKQLSNSTLLVYKSQKTGSASGVYYLYNVFWCWVPII